MLKLLILLVVAGMFALWVAAIIDIVRSNFVDNNQKLVWIVIVVMIPFLGTILYFALGQTGKIKV